MRKFKHVIAGALAALLMASSLPVMAETAAAEAAPAPLRAVMHFSGEIKEIMADYDWNGDGVVNEGVSLVMMQDDDLQVYFYITNDTFMATEGEIKEGALATGYYDGLAPAIMIYPPRYTAMAFAVDVADSPEIKVDRFDEALLSSDGELKLNVSDETIILSQDGTVFEGSLADRYLAVYYTVTTRSIPPQTAPEKIVVLDWPKITPDPDPVPEPEVSQPDNDVLIIPEPDASPPEVTLPDTAVAMPDVSSMDIMVSGKIIDAPRAFLSEDGFIMVPLRAVSEALAYSVGWDSVSAQVTVGNFITLTIGKDEYNFARRAPYLLGKAPVIKDDRTYVPLSFFREVMQVNNAYIFEGQIVIDNAEKME